MGSEAVAIVGKTIHPSNAVISYAVDIVNLSKSFRRATRARGSYTTIKSLLLSLIRRGDRGEGAVTRAVKDLTLRIPKGASVGIIGRNGSGKSTLLKLITGIYKPDRGTVQVNGRIAALIELGAGFHPDFTGRENVYLGGVMHGMTRKEIDACFADIVSFAELESVIDDPVRTYSSGMFMRLGFSLAIHTNPDVLIVDEVLAVGDATFVNKCKERIALMRKEGKTLFLVTHDLDAVERWCDEAVWLNEGEVRDRGDPRRVIDHYREFVERGEETELEADDSRHAETENNDARGKGDASEVAPERSRWGSREIEIKGVKILDKEGSARHLFHPDDGCTIEITFARHEIVSNYVFGIGIHRSDGLAVHGSNTHLEKIQFGDLPSEGVVRYRVKRLGLLDGHYLLDIAVHRDDGYPYDYHKGVLTFAVRSPVGYVGVYVPEHSWELVR